MGWIYDMTSAPKSYYEKRTRKVGEKTVEVDTLVTVRVFLAARDGKTVTPSHWIPKEGRWNMFSAKETPLAWRPYPTHPEAS